MRIPKDMKAERLTRNRYHTRKKWRHEGAHRFMLFAKKHGNVICGIASSGTEFDWLTDGNINWLEYSGTSTFRINNMFMRAGFDSSRVLD